MVTRKKRARRNPVARAGTALESFSVSGEFGMITLKWVFPEDRHYAKGEQIHLSGDLVTYELGRFVFDDYRADWLAASLDRSIDFNLGLDGKLLDYGGIGSLGPRPRDSVLKSAAADMVERAAELISASPKALRLLGLHQTMVLQSWLHARTG